MATPDHYPPSTSWRHPIRDSFIVQLRQNKIIKNNAPDFDLEL